MASLRPVLVVCSLLLARKRAWPAKICAGDLVSTNGRAEPISAIRQIEHQRRQGASGANSEAASLGNLRSLCSLWLGLAGSGGRPSAPTKVQLWLQNDKSVVHILLLGRMSQLLGLRGFPQPGAKPGLIRTSSSTYCLPRRGAGLRGKQDFFRQAQSNHGWTALSMRREGVRDRNGSSGPHDATAEVRWPAMWPRRSQRERMP